MARSARDAQQQRQRPASLAARRDEWRAAIEAWLNRLLAGGARGVAVIAAAALVLGLIGVMTINLIGQVMQGVRLDRERAVLASDIAELQRANELLRTEVEYTASDAYVERQIRDYGWAREGDVVLIAERIAGEAPDAAVAAPEVPQSVEPLPSGPNWLRWWQAVFP